MHQQPCQFFAISIFIGKLTTPSHTNMNEWLMAVIWIVVVIFVVRGCCDDDRWQSVDSSWLISALLWAQVQSLTGWFETLRCLLGGWTGPAPISLTIMWLDENTTEQGVGHWAILQSLTDWFETLCEVDDLIRGECGLFWFVMMSPPVLPGMVMILTFSFLEGAS